MRQAQYAKYGKGSAITKFVASIKAAIFAIKAKKMIESGDALGVIAGAEQLLNSCPDNPVACKLLIDAADSLGYFGVSITGYMAMARYAPTDENLLALANAYIGSRDWKMLALVKFCLCSMGMLLGLAVPKKGRKWAALGAAVLFVTTYIPLILKFLPALSRAMSGREE